MSDLFSKWFNKNIIKTIDIKAIVNCEVTIDPVILLEQKEEVLKQISEINWTEFDKAGDYKRNSLARAYSHKLRKHQCPTTEEFMAYQQKKALDKLRQGK